MLVEVLDLGSWVDNITRGGGGGGGVDKRQGATPGSGGSGGGGQGGDMTLSGTGVYATTGTVNTGSGGGGSGCDPVGSAAMGKAGGSGVVIIRYVT